MLLATLVLAAAGATTTPDLHSGPYPVDTALDAFDCDGTTTFEQLPNGGGGLAAQHDTCYPFFAEMSDNVTTTGGDIVGMGWWGVYWGGVPITPDAFQVRVFVDDEGVPGEFVAQRRVTEFNETLGDPNGYCANFDGIDTAVTGCDLHIAVVAEFCFPPQWGVATGTGDGAQGHFRSEFFGLPDWVPAIEVFGTPYEVALVVYEEDSVLPTYCCLADGSCVERSGCEECPLEVLDCVECEGTPTRTSTWGTIKALYD